MEAVFPLHCRFRESVWEGREEIDYLCERIIFSGRSMYQRIDVLDTLAHGRMLFLDGVAQSAEYDEFIYHEMLVHPALFGHPHPRSVLVIGGAEGATLREVLRHAQVDRVVMVDIDAELVEICRSHLPQWSRGSFDDPRVELVFDDGRHYVAQCANSFDCIILDLSDPDDGSPARMLFTEEFYRLIRERLNPGGSLSVQGEGIGPRHLQLHARIRNTLGSVFGRVLTCPYSLPSFHRPDAHLLVVTDPGWSLDVFAQRIELSGMELHHLSASFARGMFALPAYVARAYETDIEILTDKNTGTSFFP